MAPVTKSGRIDEPTSGGERVSIDAAGRVVIPARIRRTLGIRGGQALTIGLDGTTIRLRTIDAAIDRAQAIARRRRKEPASVVDKFIAERREDASRE